MKIAIVGSRTIEDNLDNRDMIYYFIISKIKLENIECIISGGAIGVDKIAENFAYSNQIAELRIYIPQWNKYPGKSAAFHRNKKIISEADMILIFWDGNPLSKGTLMNIDICKKMNKCYYVYNFDTKEEEYETRKAKIQ